MIHADFESRSRVNLLTQGAYNYAMDESTEPTMLAFAIDDAEPEIFLPLMGCLWEDLAAALEMEGITVWREFPPVFRQALAAGEKVAAHNAQFERLLFWYYVCPEFNLPEIPIEQFYCTASQARANNLPGDLGGCARALGVDQLKEKRGYDLIQILCIPDSEGRFVEDLELYIELAQYCLQDVRAERAISQAMRALTETELEEYAVSELINDRGLRVDVDLAAAAVRYSDAEQSDLVSEIQHLTDGKVLKARGKTITEWIYKRLPEKQQSHMHKYAQGERRLTLDKNARERIILDPDTPSLVREVTEYSDFAQASSVSKFKSMLERADPEDRRVRGAYIFNGASSTGRYSSKGLQLHNFSRDKLKHPNDIADMLIAGEDVDTIERAADHSIMQTLKRLLRHSIIADTGKTFVCGDWGQIEGRAMPWLSFDGELDPIDKFAQEKLNAYANQTHENDVYCQTASAIYRERVIRDGSDAMETMRMSGKIAELSLQFGGGYGALAGMSRNYGVHIDENWGEEIKTRWRKANPWAQPFWYALRDAAANAVKNPLTPFKVGKLTYLFQPDINKGCLWCLLPCGRVIAYPEARIEVIDGRFGPQLELTALKAGWKPKAEEKTWPRINLWYGVLGENATQGICASLLRDTLVYMHQEHDAPIVGHTHDEILGEVDYKNAEFWRQIWKTCMTTGPEWSAGLPLDVDIWVGPNYRK